VRTRAVLMVVACTVSACSCVPLLTRSSRLERGRSTFQENCAVCHGSDARGNGPLAGALTTQPADLTRIASRRGGTFDIREVARFIDGRQKVAAHGPREMPIWGRSLGDPESRAGSSSTRFPLFTPSTIYLVAEYLQSLQTGDPPAK